LSEGKQSTHAIFKAMRSGASLPDLSRLQQWQQNTLVGNLTPLELQNEGERMVDKSNKALADGQYASKFYARVAIIVLYSAVTMLELVRGTIHTFLYESGINDISGLSTGDVLCDNRLSALMIGYGGANLESFIIHSYTLYGYARHGRGKNIVRVTSIASVLWEPITRIVSSSGNIDVGGAELPGRYAMLVRAIVSLVTLLLTFV
jgi:hypothetical protein